MRSYGFNRLEVLFVLLALVVLVFTGCSGVSDEANTVNLSFGAIESEESSRTIQVNGGTTCKPGDLYWTYTAVKTSGTGTVGECKTAQPVSFDADGRGLSGFTRQFSTGGWTFTVKGYLEKAHSTMVYSGTKETVISKMDTESVVVFKLTRSSSVTKYNNGVLCFNNLVVSIPKSLVKDDKLTVQISENGALLTESELSVNDSVSVYKDAVFHFYKFSVTEKELSAGEHTLDITLKLTNGSGVSELLRAGIVNVALKANETTTLSGSLDDSLSPLFKTGGSIFYVDGTSVKGSTNGRITVDGRSFTFYTDTKGTTVGNLSSITAKGTVAKTAALATARYYTVTGNRATKTVSVPTYKTGSSNITISLVKTNLTTVADNFYVYFPKEYETTMSDMNGQHGVGGNIQPVICWEFGQPYTGTASRTYALEVIQVVSITAGSTQYPWGTETPAKIMGLGKTNCEYIMNVESSGINKPGFRLVDFVNVRKLNETGTDTMWNLMCQVNAGTLDSDLSEGFTDWYIASAYETSMLGSVLSIYSRGTSSFCLWNGSRATYGNASCLAQSQVVGSNGGVPCIANPGSVYVRFIRSF